MAALSKDRIVETALGMADRDGLDAVTLRRLAAELGVHVTSLYNHVPNLEAITDGIVEELVTRAALPSDPLPWEEWVRTFVDAIGDVAVAHPGAFLALQRRPVQGARAAASFELALAAFADAGLGPGDAYGAVKATTYVALSIALERAVQSRGDDAETLLDLLPVESFPRFHALADHITPEAAWSFSVETLVAGLHARIRELSARS